MRVRGTIRPGINYGNSKGGPRNNFWIVGQSNAADGQTSVPSELQSQYQTTFNQILTYRYSADRALNVGPLDYTSNPSYQDPAQTAQAALQFSLPVLVQSQLGGDVYANIYSIGDTALSVEWKASATVGSLYLGLVDKMNQFKRGCFNADGVNPSTKFLVWDQGEKDGRVLADANNYETNLTNFITNLRTAVGETVPVLLNLFNPDIANASVNPVTYWATIDTAKTNVAAALTAVKTVSMSNTTMETDHIHRTPAGYLTAAENIMTVAIANGYV